MEGADYYKAAELRSGLRESLDPGNTLSEPAPQARVCFAAEASYE
jgi:hypothetical protein